MQVVDQYLFWTRVIISYADLQKNPDLMDARDRTTMGEVAKKELGQEIFSIGFTSYEGQMDLPNYQYEEGSDAWRTCTINPDQSALLELEEMFHYAGFEHAFLDLRQHGAKGSVLHQPFPARFLGCRPLVSDWLKNLDGVVYPRRSFPVERDPEMRKKDAQGK